MVDGDVVPSNRGALPFPAQKWYLETLVTDSKYQLLREKFPEGVYQLKVIPSFLKTVKSMPIHLSDWQRSYKLERHKSAKKGIEKADALFQVPGRYRIYYTLKENQLEQFFELNSPVDKAYVILSTAPGGEGRAVNYAKTVMADFSAQEVTTGGRKIFVLGDLEGLKGGINVRNKSIPICSQDWNLISLDYSTYLLLATCGLCC